MKHPVISSETLTYNPENKTFTGEMSSSLGGGFLMDNTVYVKSHRTGTLKMFHLIDDAFDRDGDLMSYNFEARVSEFSRKSDVYTLVLFND